MIPRFILQYDCHYTESGGFLNKGGVEMKTFVKKNVFLILLVGLATSAQVHPLHKGRPQGKDNTGIIETIKPDIHIKIWWDICRAYNQAKISLK